MSNKPGHRGEHEGNRKTIARGMPGVTGVTVVTMLVCFVLFRTRGFGRIGRPAFPAPSIVKSGETVFAKLGRIAPRDRGIASEIGASSLRGAQATKQSILSFGGAMDCFAEPVIGRAFARPVGSQ